MGLQQIKVVEAEAQAATKSKIKKHQQKVLSQQQQRLLSQQKLQKNFTSFLISTSSNNSNKINAFQDLFQSLLTDEMNNSKRHVVSEMEMSPTNSRANSF